MASSRDDFIIAIRSAFLKKSTQNKFSLLSLLSVSMVIIILSNLNLKAVDIVRVAINEVVYRSSFIVSIPENFIKNTSYEILEYSTFFNDYRKKKQELDKLKSTNISNEIIRFENKELKELINDYALSSNKILAKIIVDHNSPFLKSIIINKGSKDEIKIGTNIYDQSYLVGRVIEVNYKTSRVLLLSDLNSNVPVTIAPQNIEAIVTGSGKNYGKLKYIKDGFFDGFLNESIVYTSGTGAVFKSGTPIGKLKVKSQGSSKLFHVEFYSDFSQLKYVFAEVLFKTEIKEKSNAVADSKSNINPIDAKLKILEDELRIIEETNSKFKKENEILKNQLNKLNSEISVFKDEISSQKKTIDKFNVDEEELKFLRLNLKYGHKCRKSFFNNKGFNINSSEYRACVLKKGVQING